MFPSESRLTRMRSSLIALVILTLAGCSTPTSPTNSEAGPLFDGGMISVGGRSGDDGTSNNGGTESEPTNTGISDPEPIDGGLGGN